MSMIMGGRKKMTFGNTEVKVSITIKTDKYASHASTTDMVINLTDERILELFDKALKGTEELHEVQREGIQGEFNSVGT